MPFIRRLIATTVAASLALSNLPLGPQPCAQGDSGLIRTEQVAAAAAPVAATVQGDHARLLATLDRADLAEQLRERGVSAGELRLRIAVLGALRHR
jgi:hypothetical protein